MIKPSVFVTRRWPKAIEAQLSKEYNVVLNTDDKPLNISEVQNVLKTYDAVLPTVTDKIGVEALDVPKLEPIMVSDIAIFAKNRHDNWG